jgi:hypothetical protein
MATWEHGPSRRELVRDEAERVLREAGRPLHYAIIAQSVFPRLKLSGHMSSKDLNTCLHEDKRRRFLRVGKGTWSLSGGLPDKRNQPGRA